MITPALRIATEALRLVIAAVLASAAAGIVAGFTIVPVSAIMEGPSVGIYGIADVFAGLFLLVAWTASGIFLGVFAGIVLGFPVALVSGSVLALLERARLIRGRIPWLIAGAAMGVLTGHSSLFRPWLSDDFDLFSDPLLLFGCVTGGTAAGWVFAGALAFLRELLFLPQPTDAAES